MRNGPSNMQMSSALSVGVEVNILRGDRVLASGIPVKDLKLEWSDSRAVPGQLTYRAPADLTPQSPLDPLNVFGQRSEVYALYRTREGEDYRVPLGQYLHTSWKEESGEVSVTALDLLQVLEDDPMPWPSSPGAGATVRSELQRLAGPVYVTLDEGVHNSPVPRTTQWGTSRVEAVMALARANGFGLRMGGDAYLHAYPIRSGVSPDVIFSHENGLLIEVERIPVQDRRPNRWVAVATVDEKSITRTATHYVSPFEPDGFGQKTKRLEVSSAKSPADVQAALDAEKAKDLLSLTSATLEVIPDARIEVGDIVGAIEQGGTVTTGRVRAYSLPVTDVGASMVIDIDILEV